MAALSIAGAPLYTCTTIAELQQTLRNFAKTNKGAWVNGTGWYTGIFTDHNLNRYVLDAAVPDRPCYIVASDGHNACLNSKACGLVGLVRGTPDPLNGHFVLDAAGEPTGMLHESATDWAESFMPVPSDDDYANGVRFSQALCNRHGITGVIDASVNERHARVYSSLEKAGALTVRVAATAKVVSAEKTEDALRRLADSAPQSFLRHVQGPFGEILSRRRSGKPHRRDARALCRRAWRQWPGDVRPHQIKELFTAFDAARFQIHVHVDRRWRAARRP